VPAILLERLDQVTEPVHAAFKYAESLRPQRADGSGPGKTELEAALRQAIAAAVLAGDDETVDRLRAMLRPKAPPHSAGSSDSALRGEARA
jgi:hypothetical protein